MTDEQVQRIVDALSNPFEPWTTLGIALISLVGGYLIAVLSHLTTERRRLRLDKVTARKSAVSRAQLVILHLVTCPPAEFEGRVSDAYRELPPIFSDLREHEPTGQIAKWWWRQALRIIAGRGAEINDGLPRSWEWDSIAEMTGARFNHWLEGLFDPDAFGAYHDALWDREYLGRRKKLTPPE